MAKTSNGSNFDPNKNISNADIWIMLGTNDYKDGDNDDPSVPADAAARVDAKIDDGQPVFGSVQGNQETGRLAGNKTECTVKKSGKQVYNIGSGTCALIIALR